MSIDLSIRSNEAELMDDLDSGGELIVRTLKEIETINKLLGGNYVTISGIARLLKNHDKKVIRIADLGCGGGDMLKRISNWCKKRHIKVELVGIDANPHVVDFARKNTAEVKDISYQVLDIFSPEFKSQEYDIITTTLFTHHFTDTQLVQLFNQFKDQASIGVVNNDLHRHWFAYYSIKYLTHWFSSSSMVKNDACLSVARSFLKDDWNKILEDAGIQRYSLEWCWAFRWQLIIHH